MGLKKLKKEAQELIDFGNSKEKAEGYGMMKVIDKLESDYSPKWRSVSWSVLDFKGRAEDIWQRYTKRSKILPDIPAPYEHANNWQDVFDKKKFKDALGKMIQKHDASLGISWETIDFYLDNMCLKKIS